MKKLIFLSLFIFNQNIYSQLPTVDNDFSASYNSNYKQYIGEYAAPATNGKLWSLYKDVGGAMKIIRLNEDGSIDSSYEYNYPSFSYSRILSKSDGSFITITSNSINSFNSDGIMISNFISPVFFSPNSYPYSSEGASIKNLVFQSDGKIIIVGNFTTVNNIPCGRIVRLNIDGSVDQSFQTGTGFNFNVTSICLYSNDKLIIAGNFGSYNGILKKRILRLNSNGTLDETFNVYSLGSSGFQQQINKIAVQSDGKILTFGSALYSNGNSISGTGTTLRLNDNGTRDTSFLNNIEYFNPNSVAIQNDGKILVDNKRLNSNGNVDITFDSSGLTGNFNLFQDLYLYNNKIYYNSNYKNAQGITRRAILRKNYDGSIDKTFNPHFGLNTLIYDQVESVCYNNVPCSRILHKTLSDGSVIIIGNFTSFDDIGCKRISKLKQDGTLDTSFNLDPAINLFYYINDFNGIEVEEQTDGKLIFNFPLPINSQTKYLWRLNSNGSLDTTFTFNIPATKIKQLSNGKFLYVSASLNTIKRLNSDLTIDTSFNCSFVGSSLNFVILNNGKYLLTRAAGGSLVPISRINSDGTIDSTFQYPLNATNIGVRKIVEQPDGKLILSYYSGNDFYYPRLKRLNSNGGFDTTFPEINDGNSIPEYVTDSGKIIIIKTSNQNYFGNNGIVNGYIVVLNNDGTLNCSFANKGGSLSIIECDKIFYSGPFYEIDGNNKNCFIKYNLSNILSIVAPTGQPIQLFNEGQTLSNLNVIGQNLQWYSNQNSCLTTFNSNKNTNSTFTNLPLSTELVNGTTYYASQTINNVESFYRLAVTTNLVLSSNDNNFDSLKLYPNPVKNNLMISNAVLIKKIELYNFIGQNLISKVFNNVNVDLDFKLYNPGVYFVKIFLENEKTKIVKIIKQ